MGAKVRASTSRRDATTAIREAIAACHAAGGGRVASGVYFYRAVVAGRTLSKKMVVLRD